MDNKKCAIINYWWADGHGAALTAFALSKLLSEKGYEPCLIKTTQGGITGEECEKGRNYKFISKHVACTRDNFTTYEDYKKLNDQYDHFLLGSDQVFRLEWVPDEWFFNAIDYEKNLIAVSASFGQDKINNSKSRINSVGKYLKRFNAISLREKDGVDVYKKNFGQRKDLEVVIDPVFLLDRGVYDDTIQGITGIEEKFIFFYILDNNPEVMELQKRIEKKYDIKVIRETSDFSIEKFLYCIKNSEMVITDSFHGTCFSMIYNKPFYCLYNKVRGVSRIKSLKSIFELDDEVLIHYGTTKDCDFDIPEIDYDRINDRIETERQKGKKWIYSKLETVKKKKKRNRYVDKFIVFGLRKKNKFVGKLLRIKRKYIRSNKQT